MINYFPLESVCCVVACYVLARFLKVHTADILDNDTVKVHINPTQVSSLLDALRCSNFS